MMEGNTADPVWCPECQEKRNALMDENLSRLPPDATADDEIGACLAADLHLILTKAHAQPVGR